MLLRNLSNYIFVLCIFLALSFSSEANSTAENDDLLLLIVPSIVEGEREPSITPPRTFSCKIGESFTVQCVSPSTNYYYLDVDEDESVVDLRLLNTAGRYITAKDCRAGSMFSTFYTHETVPNLVKEQLPSIPIGLQRVYRSLRFTSGSDDLIIKLEARCIDE